MLISKKITKTFIIKKNGPLFSCIDLSFTPFHCPSFIQEPTHSDTYSPNFMLSLDPISLHMLIGFSASALHLYVPRGSLLSFKIQLKCHLSSEDFLGCWPVCQPHAQEIWATPSVLSCLHISLAFQIHNTIQN